ncbi:MAG: winged helix-turn-helix transcriptional regulator [Candidatus Riflebacteria bacterium]|nr:winged helix-turn-helix transcriptional regulator [Candidatus Riflebacteria bacterium]
MESNRLEYKRELTDNFEKEVVSFHVSAERLELKQPATPEALGKTIRKKLQEKNYKKETIRKTAALILSLCQNNPSITIPELAEAVNLTEAGTYYQLQNLRERGLLTRIGGRKTGKWKILAEVSSKKLQEKNYEKETIRKKTPKTLSTKPRKTTRNE